jgi:hypothetical protein
MKKNILSNEKGFALLAALMACLILIAIGILVINMSTGDLFTSSATVGYKKAILAVESGVPKVINDVQPSNWTTGNPHHYSAVEYINPVTGVHYPCGADGYPDTQYDWQTIPGGTDSHTQFAICIPTQSALPDIPVAGYELGGGAGTASGPTGYIRRFESTVLGRNKVVDALGNDTSSGYHSQAKVGIGVGFGPI